MWTRDDVAVSKCAARVSASVVTVPRRTSERRHVSRDGNVEPLCGFSGSRAAARINFDYPNPKLYAAGPVALRLSKMRKSWAGLVGAGVLLSGLGASCGGEQFETAAAGGNAGSGGSGTQHAGAPTETDGGTPHGTGGSDAQAGEGQLPGDAGAGTGVGGMPDLPNECQADDPPECASKTARAVCDADGAWQTEECEAGPQDCAPATCKAGACKRTLLAPVEVKGDCNHWRCESGEATEVLAPEDTPATIGNCDVATCTANGPKLTDDDSKCAINKHCVQANCVCRECPRGKVTDAMVVDSCLLPATFTATATNVGMQATAPAGAIDGTVKKTWNAGQASGTLILTAPMGGGAMTGLVIYVTGSAGGNAGETVIKVTATIETTDSPTPIIRNGNYNYGMQATGPIQLDLGLVNVKKITLAFTSPTSWIAVNEAMFTLCK